MADLEPRVRTGQVRSTASILSIIAAMERLEAGRPIFCNLGTGAGFSVLEIIKTVEKVTGKKVPVTYGPRRAGDAIALYADPSRAKQLLGWEAKHKDPEAIIRSAWNWFEKHPRGYASSAAARGR